MSKKTKKSIVTKVVKMKIAGKTENQILSVIPTISRSTVQVITKSKSDIIEASKKKYIKLINKKIGDFKQAELLGGIVEATTEIYNFKGDIVGTRPDYRTRLDAIKYIDKLKGRDSTIVKQTQNNTFIGRELDRYIK